jgi:CxxC motif-containing protein (DUF1111 family)
MFKPARATNTVLVVFAVAILLHAQTAKDPGVRPTPIGAGSYYGNLPAAQVSMEPDFTAAFNRAVVVPNTPGTPGGGLGPVFNSNSCASCHAQPAVGGSSPANNPLFSVYQENGAINSMPAFITPTGPILVPRFVYQSDLRTPDGQVHQLFTITGRSDAGTCTVAQPNFAAAAAQNNLVFRQPIPVFGDGLLDIIRDSDILANMKSNVTLKQQLGISGHPNIVTNDHSIARFGWKAQIKSLHEMVALEEQVQKGLSNEAFPNEQNETPGCVLNGVPEDSPNFSVGMRANTSARINYVGDSQRAALFARYMAPPRPAIGLGTSTGQAQFNAIGCNLCHTQSFTTPLSSTLKSNFQVNLFSDLLVHHMGACLADNIVQGTAQGDEFRTAPLWGAGQRVFFMHDGRTTNIVTAIEDHFCAANGTYGPSEANAVVNAFNALSSKNQQALINFLRNL